MNIEEEVVKDTLENVIDKDIKNYSKTVNKTLCSIVVVQANPIYPGTIQKIMRT